MHNQIKSISDRTFCNLPNSPINHEERFGTHRNLFTPVYASPCIHSDEPTHERSLPKIKYGGVSDIRETPEVKILKWLCDRFVRKRDVICDENFSLTRQFAQLDTKIFTLLRSDLSSLPSITSENAMIGQRK